MVRFEQACTAGVSQGEMDEADDEDDVKAAWATLILSHEAAIAVERAADAAKINAMRDEWPARLCYRLRGCAIVIDQMGNSTFLRVQKYSQ